MKHPCAVLWLSEIDEVFHPEVDHLLYLHLIPFMDALQQAVDLKDLQADLCCSATHYGVRLGWWEKQGDILYLPDKYAGIAYMLHL